MRQTIAGLCVCLFAGTSGCQLVGTVGAKRPYETVVADQYHDLEEAEDLTRKAHQAMAISHWGKAESYLKEALVADVNYGPAHNSLGWLYYQQQQLYLAAWEFEYAARLMPELPEPLNNQGLVLEAGGRYVEAAARFEEALLLGPEHPETIANLARCLVRLDGRDEGHALRSAELLRDVALRDQRPEWREWARELLATRYVDCDELLAGGTLACPIEIIGSPVLLPDATPLMLPLPGPPTEWTDTPELDVPTPNLQPTLPVPADNASMPAASPSIEPSDNAVSPTDRPAAKVQLELDLPDAATTTSPKPTELDDAWQSFDVLLNQ